MINCQFENGHKASLRHTTVDVIAVKNNEILLVRRSNKILESDKLSLPGGFVERDETTSQGALREFKEETGYMGSIKALMRINDRPDRKGEDRQNVDFVFIVNVKEKVSQPDWETSETKWYSLDNLPKSQEVAFDHYESIMLYKRYLKENFSLPIIESLINK